MSIDLRLRDTYQASRSHAYEPQDVLDTRFRGHDEETRIFDMRFPCGKLPETA